MVHQVFVDSTDDFIMWRPIDAIKPVSTPRVLVVDDYPVGADALQLLLEKTGLRLAQSMTRAWRARSLKNGYPSLSS